MGVPYFMGYLMKKFKKYKFVYKQKEENIDWFLIDTNSALHPVCFSVLAQEQTKDNINFDSLQNKMINAIIDYLTKLIEYVDPKIGVYIAIDGPVCAAKMKQQRQRRFRSVYDKKVFDNIKIKYDKLIPFFWSNSAISPGTSFMHKLHRKIIEWASSQSRKIIYSSSNVPGEGEHKLLQFIKDNNNDNLSYVTYGLDADLIFLMLVTKSDNVYLLRESSQLNNSDSSDELLFVSIKIMKECIYNSFNNKSEIELNKNRIINDFIFICYFIGNDFLPHIHALDINNDGIGYMINKYMIVFAEINDYLLSIDTLTINNLFLYKFILKLSEEEHNILISHLNHNKKPKYFGNDDYEREIHKITNVLFKVDNSIDFSDNNYRNNYYKHYFDLDDNEIEEFVQKMVYHYLKGIRWVSYYYFQKIPDWNWYYPYDYAPFISDIYKYISNINFFTFTEGTPITPLEQLLVILPTQSKFLLPNNFAKLVSNPKSSLIHLYPIDIKVDFLYKNKFYEGIPLLPQLEIDLVRYIFKKYKDELTFEELQRNRLDNNIVFN